MVNKKNKYAIINPSIYWKRLYRQFAIFYRSKFGRAGFYILLAFAIITVIAPYVGGNVGYYASAPAIDSTLASPIAGVYLNNATHSNNSSFYGPMSSSVESEGYTGAIYTGNTNGSLYYVGLGDPGTPKGSVGQIYSSKFVSRNEKMLKPVIFDLINGVELYKTHGTGVVIHRFVVLPYSNSSFTVGEIEYRDSGYATPHFIYLYNVKLNGTIVGNITSNAIAFDNTPSTPMPEYCFNSAAKYPNGRIYIVTKNTTGLYMNEFGVYPFSYSISFRIGMNNINGIEFYGEQFSTRQANNYSRILVYNYSSVWAYASSNSSLIWQDSFTKINTQNGLTIPSFYQSSVATNNSLYLISNKNEIFSVNLESGHSKLIYKFPYDTYSISTSQGLSGPPSYIIGTSQNYFQILSSNKSNAKYQYYEVPFSSSISGKVLTHACLRRSNQLTNICFSKGDRPFV
ncbi:MAG: hypothetical protein AMDU5_GPLC00008G0007 [Thermoplasmatales archaeon Gpl]|nr:MAG: hypothetical protein AMDU5_GPLC00008G0007 [Thermoplasmatales archaeon Gpl]